MQRFDLLRPLHDAGTLSIYPQGIMHLQVGPSCARPRRSPASGQR